MLTLQSNSNECLKIIHNLDNLLIHKYILPKNVEVFIINKIHSTPGLKGRAVSGKRNRIFMFKGLWLDFLKCSPHLKYKIEQSYTECLLHEYSHLILDNNELSNKYNIHDKTFFDLLNILKNHIGI